MNEQIKSLAFYLGFARTFERDKTRKLILDQVDVLSYLEKKLNQFMGTGLLDAYKAGNWTENVELMRLDEIDIATCLDDALDIVYGESYFKQYAKRTCKDDQDALLGLREDVNSFWKRLNSYGKRAYGLAVGRVQSGKTRNYIGLMLKAIDDGFNVVIVLTSKNKRLAVQTHKRVRRWVDGGGGRIVRPWDSDAVRSCKRSE